jgi:hypothetical protein
MKDIINDKTKEMCEIFSKKIYDVIPKEFLEIKEGNYKGKNYTIEGMKYNLIFNYFLCQNNEDIDVKKIVETYKSFKVIDDEIEINKQFQKMSQSEKEVFDKYTEKYGTDIFINNIDWLIERGTGKRQEELLKELEKEGLLKKYLEGQNSKEGVVYFYNDSIPNFLMKNIDPKSIFKDYGIADFIGMEGTSVNEKAENSKQKKELYNNFVLENIDKKDKESVNLLKYSKIKIYELIKDEKNNKKLKELLQGIKFDCNEIKNTFGYLYGLDFLIKLNNIVNENDEVINLFENKDKMLDYIGDYKITIEEAKKYLGLNIVDIMNLKNFRFNLINIETIKEINRKELMNVFKGNKHLILDFLSFLTSKAKYFEEFFIKKDNENKEIYELNKDFYEVTKELSLKEVMIIINGVLFVEFIENKIKKENKVEDFRNLIKELVELKKDKKHFLNIEKIIEKSIIKNDETVKNKEDINKTKIMQEIILEDYLKKESNIKDFTFKELRVLFKKLSYENLKTCFIKLEDDKDNLIKELIDNNRRRVEGDNIYPKDDLFVLFREFVIKLINEYGINKINEEDVFLEFDIRLKDIKNNKIKINDLSEDLLKELLDGLNIEDIIILKEKKEMLASNKKDVIVKNK